MKVFNDKVVEEFLNAQTKRGTFFTYKSSMALYLEFTKKNGQQLLDEKKKDSNFQVENSMFQFRKWLLENKKSETYATSTIMCVRSFYSYFRVPLVFRKQEAKKLTEKNRSTTDYLFDREDLTRMAFAGSLKERYVLLVGKSIGLRAGDFIRLTVGCFRSINLEGEPPIPLGEIGTEKERVKAYPFLDSDAVPVVKAWLESHKDAKDSDRVVEDDEDNLTVILQTLCEKAGMEIQNGTIHGKRIRFHCLRKFLIDRLSAYASESQWKQIVGKAIDEGAYVSQDQLRAVFGRAMKDLVINGNGIKIKKLTELENALLDSQKRLTSVETTNDVLRKELDKVTQKVDFLDKYLNLGDAVETKEDAQRLLDFMEKMRYEKYVKEKVEQSKNNA
jgi:hypothetical protein